MRLWFSHNSGVTLREQLVTQIILGILSGELAPGQRLPSTRELARRFRLHPNTVSSGYRQLQSERWVEFSHGSGVYVSRKKPEASGSAALALDRLILNLFRSAKDLSMPLSLVRSRLRQWLEMQPPDHFLFIEQDEELRRIVAFEMERAVTFPVRCCGIEDITNSHSLEGAIPVALPNRAKIVQQVLPAGIELITLSVRSVPASLTNWLPAPPGALVGVASSWPGFLKFARTMLLAAGFHSDGLLFRDARKTDWRRGLKQSAAIVCDSLVAAQLVTGPRAIIFPLLAESSIAELRRYQDFVERPLAARM
jgi:GntR family transcriptional regulator